MPRLAPPSFQLFFDVVIWLVKKEGTGQAAPAGASCSISCVCSCWMEVKFGASRRGCLGTTDEQG